MSFSPKRTIIGAVLILAVLALFIIVQPDDSNDNDETTGASNATLATGATGPVTQPKPKRPSPPPVPQVVVNNGEPQGGVVELDFDQGDDIRFSVKSDVEEEVHVHGYDVSKPIAAGGKVSFDFPAEITGIFEVELEHSAVPIAELQVNP
jgi:hypothetical protein